MMGALLIGVGALALGPDPSQDDRAAYRVAAARAGEDPVARVGLALWCEARGLKAEAAEELAAAIRLDPANARARGLMGRVAEGDQWLLPEEVGARRRADPRRAATLAEYRERRGRLVASSRAERDREQALASSGHQREANERRAADESRLALAHAQLGLWCEQHGLEPQATAHFTTAVVLDPHDDAFWKHLGYVRRGARWMSPEQSAAQEAEARAQKLADAHWGPLLRKWKGWLAERSRRDEAERALAGVTDPRAAPAIITVFGHGAEADQLRAVALFGAIDAPETTRDLAAQAVLSPSGAVRTAATQALRGREARDFAGALVDLIRAPIRYQVEPVTGPGSRGKLTIDTPRFHLVRSYEAPPAFVLTGSLWDYVGLDPNGLPVAIGGWDLRNHWAPLVRDTRHPMRHLAAEQMYLRRAESRTALMFGQANLRAVATQQRINADVAALEALNAEDAIQDERIVMVLREAAGAPDLRDDDEDGWHAWWYDTLGYHYVPPRKRFGYQIMPHPMPPLLYTCFVAGTPVRTIDGDRPIEALEVGDLVLSQDVTTGALSFEPVLVVHRNPPDRTLTVTLDDGEALTCSVYHRFWRAGRGWAMARELQPGDILRVLGGVVRVATVGPQGVQPLFNLDVARNRTFLVGRPAALVHDNTLPPPRLAPFDGVPELAAAP